MDLIVKTKLISLLNKVLRQDGKQTSEDEIIFICPFHSPINNITRKKFGINLVGRGAYNCFACGESGKSFRTLFKKLKVRPEYYKELYALIGKDLDIGYNKSKKYDFDTQSIDLILPTEFQNVSIPSRMFEYKHIINYLRQRNITREDVLRYNIGYCLEGKYKNRIIIPSYDKDGHINFFAARDFFGYSSYKYLLPHWSKDIIGFELFINWEEESGITLVEGTFDAVTIRKNAIPLFGKRLSNKLIETIYENDVKRINICLDNDAIKDSIKIYNNLYALGFDDIRIIPIKEKDASEIGFVAINNLINNTTSLNQLDLFKLKLNT